MSLSGGKLSSSQGESRSSGHGNLRRTDEASQGQIYPVQRPGFVTCNVRLQTPRAEGSEDGSSDERHSTISALGNESPVADKITRLMDNMQPNKNGSSAQEAVDGNVIGLEVRSGDQALQQDNSNDPSRTQKRSRSRATEASKHKAGLRKLFNGEAYEWAPCTIFCRVTHLLSEPLPKAKDTGCIYVAPVILEEGFIRSIIMIGYTLRPRFEDRLNEVSTRHGLDFDMKQAFGSARVPYVQLLRREAVIHADPASYQRNLLLPSERSVKKGQRT